MVMGGPQEKVTGPQAAIGRSRLLDAAIPVNDGARWEGGFAFVGDSCDAMTVQTIGCTFDEKGAVTNTAATSVVPWIVLGHDNCSTMSGISDAERVARARRNLIATESYQAEKELWNGTAREDLDPTGTTVWSHQWLMDSAAYDDIPGGPFHPVRALAIMESWLGDCLAGQRGMIHTNRETATVLHHFGLLEQDGPLLVTALGNIVVAGAGYDIEDTGYIFGTGLVYLRQGEISTVGDETSRVIRDTNSIEVLVERPMALYYSPCCHFRVVADLDVLAASA